MDLKGAVSTALREVGEMIYATHTGTLTESEVLLAKLQEIDGLRQQIDPAGAGRSLGSRAARCAPSAGRPPERRRILPGMRPKAVRRKRKMEYTFAQYQESAQALRDRLGAFPPPVPADLGLRPGLFGQRSGVPHCRPL